jgi:putative phosphoribosyl transferase
MLERTSANKGRLVQIEAEAIVLTGIVSIPDDAKGLAILINSIGDESPLTHQNALQQGQYLYQQKIATLLVDLFTTQEQQLDQETGYFRQNTDIMQQRIIGIATWLLEQQHATWLLEDQQETRHFSLGYFGAGISGAAALIAAANRPDAVTAVVAVNASLDTIKDDLPRVTTPTLLLAAEKDQAAVDMNQHALEHLHGEKQFEPIKGVSSLFEDAAALNEIARMTGQWFTRWLVVSA